jgi:glucokinase
MQHLLGIEIGGTKLQLVLAQEPGKISERRKLTIEPAKGALGIRQQIEGELPGLLRHGRPAAIGVGFGGPVDWKAGKISRSHQIAGWSEFDLGSWLQQLTGASVIVDNDGNVAALGEATYGAGIRFNPVFYVTLGSGVGGGLVVDGRIYHGVTPGESEIGHVRLDRSGTTVESRCSGWAMDAKIRALKTSEPNSALVRMAVATDTGEAKHLSAALQADDSAAKRILDELVQDLAFGLSHVVHLFHPQIIILGGGMAGLGESLRAGVESALANFIMEVFAPGPRIALSVLGEDAVPVGALELARAKL